MIAEYIQNRIINNSITAYGRANSWKKAISFIAASKIELIKNKFIKDGTQLFFLIKAPTINVIIWIGTKYTSANIAIVIAESYQGNIGTVEPNI